MLSFLFRGACPFGLPTPPTPPDSAGCGARFRRHWGAITFPVGHDYGKWGTIPLQLEKCPTSQRNPAPHRSGIAAPLQTESVPHFDRNPHQAHGGTLFLDEIGEMPRAAQPRLLRVLEDLRVRRLGSRAEVSVDVRVLAATSQPAETRLRDDLFYRLSVFQILLPPLRARAEDIPLMAQVMIQILNKKNGTLVAGMDSEVLRAFKTYHWPGNARELRNVIERATIVAGTGMLHLDHLPSTTVGQTPAAPAKGSITLLPGRHLAEIEESYITLTLQYASRNITQAAALLGITPRTLRNRIASFPKATKAATSSG